MWLKDVTEEKSNGQNGTGEIVLLNIMVEFQHIPVVWTYQNAFEFRGSFLCCMSVIHLLVAYNKWLMFNIQGTKKETCQISNKSYTKPCSICKIP